MKMLDWSVDLTSSKTDAENRINEYFNAQAVLSIQKDQEHKAKRDIANAVLSDPSFVPPASFSDEAQLMGIEVSALAQQIIDKPDEILERGLRRRADILSVRNASVPAAIEDILKKYSSERA